MGERNDFSRKIDELETQINALTHNAKQRQSYVSMKMILGVATPIITFLVLFFWSPRIVEIKEGDEYTRSTRRVVYWTVGVTLVVYALIFMYTRMYGRGDGGALPKYV